MILALLVLVITSSGFGPIGGRGGREAGKRKTLGERTTRNTPSVLVSSYEIDMTALPGGAGLKGSAFMRFSSPTGPSDSLDFFLHDELTVDSVQLAGVSLPFRSTVEPYFLNYTTRALRTRVEVAGRSLDGGMRVFYHGPFSPSSARSPSDYMRVDESGVLLRSYGYSLWFPVFLDVEASSYSVDVPRAVLRVPRGIRSVFVGSRVRNQEEGPYWETEWTAEDVDLTQIQWAAQRWEVLSFETYHAYHNPTPLSRQAAQEILAFARSMTRRYQRSYRSGVGTAEIYLLEMPPFGMISSANVSALPSEEWQAFSEQANVQVSLAHEMVHPFVSFSVPFDDPGWALIQEGFPSFFHLPVLGVVRRSGFYRQFLSSVEEAYLQKRSTGVYRGQRLPPEKPLLEISRSEVGAYKDTFVLDDRARLFLDWLRRQMGNGQYAAFVRRLFSCTRMDAATFVEIIQDYLPGSEEDIHLWLGTTDFPDRFRLDFDTAR